ncbi:MAG: NUDIX hydrolase [Pseudomonadota bacterium]
MTELYRGKFLGLYQTGTWEYCTRVNSRAVVVVAAMTQQQEVLLVEQFRPPVAGRVMEFPAGLVGDLPGAENEALTVAAQRELEEETGYTAGSLEPLMKGPVSAGLTSEQIHFFLGRELTKTGAGGGVSTEDITVHTIKWGRCHDWLAERQAQGILVDPKVYGGLYFLGRNLALD